MGFLVKSGLRGVELGGHVAGFGGVVSGGNGVEFGAFARANPNNPEKKYNLLLLKSQTTSRVSSHITCVFIF